MPEIENFKISNVIPNLIIKSATKEEKEDNWRTYYHATTISFANEIKVNKLLKGSSWEAGYVYAWERIPTRKALYNSGAYNCNLIVSFKTHAAFEPDEGIENDYIKSFYPVRSIFNNSTIFVDDVEIIPIF